MWNSVGLGCWGNILTIKSESYDRILDTKERLEAPWNRYDERDETMRASQRNCSINSLTSIVREIVGLLLVL